MVLPVHHQSLFSLFLACHTDTCGYQGAEQAWWQIDLLAHYEVHAIQIKRKIKGQK